MFRYKLRTLLIVLALGPPVIAEQMPRRQLSLQLGVEALRNRVVWTKPTLG